MALGNKRNIIVGAASVFIGPAGSATPSVAPTRAAWVNAAGTPNDPTPPAVRAIGWRNVGYTSDGFEISTDPSYGEVEVDQLLDSALIFKDGMSLSISTTFAEASLENLLVAWGQADSTMTSTATSAAIDIMSGALGEAPRERGLIAIGSSPRGAAGTAYGDRVYHAFRVLSVEGSSLSSARADASTIPVTFRALPDDLDGRYGVIRDTVGT